MINYVTTSRVQCFIITAASSLTGYGKAKRMVMILALVYNFYFYYGPHNISVYLIKSAQKQINMINKN